MRMHTIVLPAVAGAALLAVGCSGGGASDDPTPAATFTAADDGCDIATDGFIHEAGPIVLEFVNELDVKATIQLVDPSGSVAATEEVPSAESVERQIDLEAGEHLLRCSNGASTWDSTGAGATPSGIVTGSTPPAYTVGS